MDSSGTMLAGNVMLLRRDTMHRAPTMVDQEKENIGQRSNG